MNKIQMTSQLKQEPLLSSTHNLFIKSNIMETNVMTPEIKTQAKSNLDMLLGKLETYGDTSPIWNRLTPKDQQAIIEVDGTKVEEIEGKYGSQLQINHANGMKSYISLKNGVAAKQPSYRLAEFEAVRPWEEYEIEVGDKKLFALSVAEGDNTSPASSSTEDLTA